MNRLRRFLLTWSLALCAILAITKPLVAEEFRGSLPAEIADAARQILEVMDAVKRETVEVGQFVPFGNSQSNGGPGVRFELVQALEAKRKGVVQDKASLAVQGTFGPVNDPTDSATPEDRRFTAERLNLAIIDKTNGDTIKPITVFVRRLRDIATIEGLTANLDPNDLARKQNRDLKERLDQSRVFVRGPEIRSSEQSPFTLKIAVRKSDGSVASARSAEVVNGFARVPIDKTELYELHITNGSASEIAVSVKIDGIDVFAFSDDRDAKTGRPFHTHFIVPAGKSLELPGWHKTNDPKRTDNFQRFLVTEYGQGAASRFPAQSQGNVGVITIAISLSHIPGSGQSKSGAETGFGPPVKADLKVVERQIDPPHDFISVRYLR